MLKRLTFKQAEKIGCVSDDICYENYLVVDDEEEPFAHKGELLIVGNALLGSIEAKEWCVVMTPKGYSVAVNRRYPNMGRGEMDSQDFMSKDFPPVRHFIGFVDAIIRTHKFDAVERFAKRRRKTVPKKAKALAEELWREIAEKKQNGTDN